MEDLCLSLLTSGRGVSVMLTTLALNLGQGVGRPFFYTSGDKGDGDKGDSQWLATFASARMSDAIVARRGLELSVTEHAAWCFAQLRKRADCSSVLSRHHEIHCKLQPCRCLSNVVVRIRSVHHLAFLVLNGIPHLALQRRPKEACTQVPW